MKERIINISLIISGICMLVLMCFNLPAKLFIFTTILDSNLYTLIYLINFSIYFIITLILLIVFKKEYLNFKGFKEYIVILSIIFFVTLLIYFIQDFNLLGSKLSFIGILLDGVITPVINTFIKGLILFGLIIIPLLDIIRIKKFRYLLFTSIAFILLSVINMVIHINDYTNYIYYISEALCFSALGVYLIIYEKTLLTPTLYYALSMICVLPNCFSSVLSYAILGVARYGCGVFYMIVGAIIIYIGIRKEIE